MSSVTSNLSTLHFFSASIRLRTLEYFVTYQAQLGTYDGNMQIYNHFVQIEQREHGINKLSPNPLQHATGMFLIPFREQRDKLRHSREPYNIPKATNMCSHRKIFNKLDSFRSAVAVQGSYTTIYCKQGINKCANGDHWRRKI